MKYFAYGSNMSLLRLQHRVASAVKISVCTLEGYRLCFHKKSQDGSGKCDAYHTGELSDVIYGVVFEMSTQDKPALDKVEGVGLGYEIKLAKVSESNGEIHEAFMYVATSIEPSLKPYSWYVHHVLTGAKEANLPSDYVEAIKRHESAEDPDRNRHQFELEIYTKDNEKYMGVGDNKDYGKYEA